MNEIYNTEQLIQKNKINREAFYNILELLKITDRKEEYEILKFVIKSSYDDLSSLANEVSKVKTEDRKPPRKRKKVWLAYE